MVCLKNVTLADRIAGFSKIKFGKAAVKVPELKAKARPMPQKAKNDIPVSSIVNILIKNAVEKAKREKKEKQVEEDKSYKIMKDDREIDINGGYGTVSKSYGMSPRASYADYGKMLSHLGAFRAKQPYENMAEHLSAMNRAAESSSFALVDSETLQKGGFYVKYFAHPGRFDMYSALGSLVCPVPGMNSMEWEKFKLLMMIDKPLYTLKISTS